MAAYILTELVLPIENPTPQTLGESKAPIAEATEEGESNASTKMLTSTPLKSIEQGTFFPLYSTSFLFWLVVTLMPFLNRFAVPTQEGKEAFIDWYVHLFAPYFKFKVCIKLCLSIDERN